LRKRALFSLVAVAVLFVKKLPLRYFGEVESKFKVQGYVPSIDPVKKVRIIKAPEKLVEDEDVIEDLDDNGNCLNPVHTFFHSLK